MTTDLPPPRVAFVQTVESVMDPEAARPMQPSPTRPDEALATVVSDLPGWSVRVGAGALAVPSFAGARTYRLLPLPAIDVGYRDLLTANVADGLSVALLRSNGLHAGPTLRYRFGQYESHARQGLQGLGDVPGSIEAGTTVRWERSGLGLRGYTGWDLGTGHGGGVAELSAFASRRLRLSSRRILFVRAGPAVTFATERFFRSYFGVDAAQASSSGLSPYRPKGGLERVGVDGSMTLSLDRRWAFTLTGSAASLTGEAARSPRVRERGSRRQGTLGAFLTYAL